MLEILQIPLVDSVLEYLVEVALQAAVGKWHKD
jgi:hypothetical protein